LENRTIALSYYFSALSSASLPQKTDRHGRAVYHYAPFRSLGTGRIFPAGPCSRKF
jgi:hypothetical protein